jgi:hypothetical protein
MNQRIITVIKRQPRFSSFVHINEPFLRRPVLVSSKHSALRVVQRFTDLLRALLEEVRHGICFAVYAEEVEPGYTLATIG